MIVPNLKPLNSALSRLQEIPETFFRNLERATSFDDSLFPDWVTRGNGNTPAFSNRTALRQKFRAIFDKYKAIQSVDTRKKVTDAFIGTNQILALCNNEAGTTCIELEELDETIRAEIDDAFLYLYNSALKNPDFEGFVGTNIKATIRKYLDENRFEICPFCGLETILLVEGQDTVPLDHWLNKDRFPFASVNFQNLIPIGTQCNSRSVKGTKNVLKDATQTNRTRAYYPYSTYRGVNVSIYCTTLPSIDNELGLWKINISPQEPTEQECFDSWSHIFNIQRRFKSYFEDYPCLNWEKDYAAFVKNEDDEFEVRHANNIQEFKENLRQWKRSFPLKKRHGSVIYRPFLDYLINQAPDYYLQGLVENILSKDKAGFYENNL